MEPDAIAHQLGRQHIALEQMADQENHRDFRHADPFWWELRERHADRERRADQRADEGNEGDESGDQANDEAELQAGQRQANAIERSQAKADQRLAAHVARDGSIGLVGHRADGSGVIERQGAVDRPSTFGQSRSGRR
jgi:hypothetical protein